MRRLLLSCLAVGLSLGVVPRAFADAETQALIEKAIKAHGGREVLSKERTIQSKTKGTLELLGGLSFTQEITLQLPKQLKEVMDLEVNGMKVSVTTAMNGDKAWITANGKDIEVTDKIKEELHEAAYRAEVMGLVKLKDKKFDISSLGEITVNDKKAVGIKVASKGHKDINVYFDTDSGLITRVDLQALDSMTGEEVPEERIINEYQEVEGQKVAKKMTINRASKKFMEAEVTEVKFVDKLDDSHFAKP